MYKQFSAITRLMAILISAVALTTCQTLQSVLKEPLVSLNSAELININFSGVDMLFKINVENPNPFDLSFPEMDWNVFINTNGFVNGTIRNNESLKGRKITIVDVPVHFNYLDVFNTIKSLRGSKQADYKIALAAKFNLPVLGEKVFHLSHEGVFPVLQMPKISMPAMKIDKLDFTKAELLFTVNIENPNSFDLPSPKMAYDYLVNKNSFIKSSITNTAPLAAAAVTPVFINLTVNYADLYKAFQALRSLNEVPGLLSLKSDFSIPAFGEEPETAEAAGSLPLLKAPSISFAGISLKNLSLTSIDFEVAWEVENNNSFAMGVKDFSYNLAVNNSRWGSGKVPGAPLIGPNRKTKIPLTISINSLSMVMDLTQIITKGTDVSYSCTGALNLGADLPGLADFNTPFNFNGATKLKK